MADGWDALRGVEPLEQQAAPSPAKRDSPEWWVQRLHAELAKKKRGYQKLSDYYEGKHKLAFASSKFRAAFGALLKDLADDWCGLVVDAAEERLNVQGFRFPQSDAEQVTEATAGDQDAWAIWQANDLDAGSQMEHIESLVNGCAYVLVWPENGGPPRITPESPEQVTVGYVAGSYRRAAALKEWWDDWEGYLFATLYLPTEVYKFRSSKPVKSASDLGQATSVRWMPREVDGEDWPLKNPLGIVPMVPFENRPRLLRPGVSEISKVIPIQNGVNKLVADMLVASEFQSFRQRWATGLEIPKDPETGQPLEPFKAAVDRMWTSEDKDTTFGEFGQVDLQGFVQAIEMLIQHIASQTRTPPHYFFLRGNFPSGESIKSAETGLVAKVRRKMRHYGEAWEEVMRLAFAVKGDARAKVLDAETIWGDPESRSESEHVDALVKLQALGVPNEILWEKAGFSPQEIERMKQMVKESPAVPSQMAKAELVAAGVSPNGGGYGG